jgi:O-antigen/teichoic acid export membrane protein
MILKNNLNIKVSIYVFASIFQKGLGALLVPIYTRYLSPSEFGQIGLIISMSGLFVLFSSFALDDAVMKFSHKNVNESDNSLVGAILLMNLFLTILTISALILSRHLIMKTFLSGIQSDFYKYFVFLSVLPNLFSIVQKMQVIKEKTIGFAIYSMLFFVLNSSISLYCLIYREMGAESLLISALIANSVFFIWSFFDIYKFSKFNLVRSDFRKIIDYCWPLFLNRLLSWFGVQFVLFIIAWKFDLFNAGLFSVLAYVSLMFTVVSQAITNVVTPKIFRLLTFDNLRSNKIIFNLVEKVFFVNVLLALSIIFTGDVMFSILFDLKYLEARKFVYLVVLSSLISSFGGLFNVFFFYLNNKQIVILLTTFTSTLIVLFTIYFLSPYGVIAAYLSTIFGASVVLIINSVYINRLFEVSMRNFIIQVAVAISFCFLMEYLKGLEFVYVFLFYITALIYYIICLKNNNILFKPHGV